MKTNADKTKGAREWLNGTGKRVKRHSTWDLPFPVRHILLSRASGARILTCITNTSCALSRWVLILVRRNQRCRITYTTMTSLSTERVPGRDKGKIMKLKIHYTTIIWDVLHSDKRSYLWLRNWAVSSPSCYKRQTQVETFGQCNGWYTFFRQKRKTG